MSSPFKTSARNPQYYSIIRTRSSSGNPGDGSVEIGVKRSRGSSYSSSAPPTKTLQLNSGEIIATLDASDDEKESLTVKRKSSKDFIDARKSSSSGPHRPRTRSLSNSDPVSPTLKTSPSFTATPSEGTGGNSSGGQRNSPVTRASAATMKKTEFVSLPTRRRRGGKRGGRGRGSFSGRGRDNVEGDYDADVFPTVTLTSGRSESVEKTVTEQRDAEEEPVQPLKRKRGRPPKIRKETPSTVSPASQSSKSSGDSATPAKVTSSSAPSSVDVKPNRRISSKAASKSKDKDKVEEDMLTGTHSTQSKGKASSKSKDKLVEDPLGKGKTSSSSMKLPLWDTFGKEVSDETKEIEDSDRASKPPSSPSEPRALPKLSSKSQQATPVSYHETAAPPGQCSYVVTSSKNSSGGFKAVTVTTLNKKTTQRDKEEPTPKIKTRRSSRKASSSNTSTDEELPVVPKSNDTADDADVGGATTDSTHKQRGSDGEPGVKTKTRSKKTKVDKEAKKEEKEVKTDAGYGEDDNSSNNSKPDPKTGSGQSGGGQVLHSSHTPATFLSDCERAGP